MPSTILLDQAAWDLLLDSSGNIARADEPYSLAQDAASAVKTFLGEPVWDTTLGVPYLEQILGKNPPVALIKALVAKAAQGVPGVQSAKCFVASISARVVGGQVQVTSAATGQTSAINFQVTNPQGTG